MPPNKFSSVKKVEYQLLFCKIIYLDCVLLYKHAVKELGQYPAEPYLLYG